MKKKLLVVLVALCSVFAAEAQVKKAAVISVFGSRNLSDNPMETKMYEAIMKDSSFNLVPIVNEFDKVLTEAFLPEFPFPFEKKENVVTNDKYKGLVFHTRYAKENWTTTSAEDYIPIAAFGVADDNEAIKKSFEFLDVDAVMIVYINFEVYDAGGIGPLAKKKVYANVNVKLFDKDAKRIFKLKERATSKTGVLAVGGIITDVKEVMTMVQESSDQLIIDMKKTLPKKLAKMAKKLAKG